MMTDRMAIRSFVAALVLVFVLPLVGAVPWAEAVAAPEGTGLPLPRFVKLRASEVNMRTGPGVQYPVEWVYNRRNLPVEVIAEYNTWRKVRDWQGTQGWVHQSMLGGERAMIIIGKLRTLRTDPDTQSTPIAHVEPGVVGRLVDCPADGGWCKVELDQHAGWLRRVEFWGVYPGETVK
jgi:SH3-like domain-containing protein